jgi:serine/threonine protein phosphatase PrpC
MCVDRAKDSWLTALFDGHGKFGDKVSQFCVEQTKAYYASQDYTSDPDAFIVSL